MNPSMMWGNPMAQDGNSWPLLDWIEKSESAAAEDFEAAIEDPATLAMSAAGWRAYFAGKAALPAEWRGMGIDVDAASMRRGHDVGGLGDDYPIGMYEAVRAGWAAAVRGLMTPQAFMPDVQHLAELAQIAGKLDDFAAPELAPHSARIVKLPESVTHGRVQLRCISRKGQGEPILVVASMINRWYILDFLPGQSFLGMLAELDRPVYLMEWLPPAKTADDRSLPELVEGPLAAVVDHVCDLHGAENLNLVGYCMGGTLSAAYAATFPDKVARLATVCGPVEFAHGGAFRKWFAPELLDVDLVSSSCDVVPAAMVHLPFWWLRPTIKVQKAVRLVRSHGTPGYIDRFLAAEAWNQDNVDMARGVFRSWAGDLYQRDAMVNGQFVVARKAVDLGSITCPTLVVTGGFDAITPADSCESLAHSVGSEFKDIVRLRGSHTGVLTNPKLLATQKDNFTAWLGEPAGAHKGS